MSLRVEMLWSTFGEPHPTNEGNTRGKPAEWSEQRSRGNWGRLGDIWRARLPLPVLLFHFSLLAVTKAWLSASYPCQTIMRKPVNMLRWILPPCAHFYLCHDMVLSSFFPLSFCGFRDVLEPMHTSLGE
jgi:hypothetical protein